MALEITNTEMQYLLLEVVLLNITFTLRNGTVYLNGEPDLPVKFATASDLVNP